ncbi:PoNe immunity protein domain-containing protein [Metabacillus malikii]|uniref:DUF1911 domain-containing protein n=1 Tax=Metabacillus malikii TaxID=1504265 RepID=A0ABT9ZLH3_9BACI|nr:PoNe immunity protein domain-containing protein [Metabacillus malikii]MDQ0233117.1 hypothetical protein [Metabacillus malikii]
MRDTLRSTSYFNKYLDDENRKLVKYKLMAEKVLEERGEEDQGLKRAYLIIQNSYFNKLNSLYSMGAPIEEIKLLYPEIIDILKKSWNKESGYVRILWMISIGIMLDVSQKYINQLKNLVTRFELQDYLLDFLLNKENSNRNDSNKGFTFSEPYSLLYDVINAKSKNEAVEKLKYYLEEAWYNGHGDTGWYESHKSKHDTYNGYWSYESGAIARILDLDDQILRDVPYYPYDLVHYKDNKN